MPNHSFSFKTAKFFGRKSSGSAKKKKPDELSVKGSTLVAHENSPISEIVVVTEIWRDLGRRIHEPREPLPDLLIKDISIQLQFCTKMGQRLKNYFVTYKEVSPTLLICC